MEKFLTFYTNGNFILNSQFRQSDFCTPAVTAKQIAASPTVMPSAENIEFPVAMATSRKKGI